MKSVFFLFSNIEIMVIQSNVSDLVFIYLILGTEPYFKIMRREKKKQFLPDDLDEPKNHQTGRDRSWKL